MDASPPLVGGHRTPMMHLLHPYRRPHNRFRPRQISGAPMIAEPSPLELDDTLYDACLAHAFRNPVVAPFTVTRD